MRPISSCPIQAFFASFILLVVNIGGCPPPLSPAGDQRSGSPIPAGVYSGEASHYQDVYSDSALVSQYSSTVPVTFVFNEAGQVVGRDGNPVVSGTTSVGEVGALTATKSVESVIAMTDSIIVRGTSRWEHAEIPGDPLIGPFTITLKFLPPNQVEYEESTAVVATSGTVAWEMTWSGILTK